MEAFNELRKQARVRRDKSITAAHDLYADALTRIAALQQDLFGRPSSTHKTLAACVERVMPRDRPFTTVDIMAGLEALEPGRPWPVPTVNARMTTLRRLGLIRRLRRSKKSEHAIYVRVGVEVAPLPYEGKTLVDAMLELLANNRMTMVELAVALLEAGYPTKLTPRGMRAAVSKVLRADRRFVRKGDRWSVVDGD